MVLTGHKVTLYVYDEIDQVPEGIKFEDAIKFLMSQIF